MDKDMRSHIKENFQLFETDELVEIWNIHDTDEWTEDAFIVLREVLIERTGAVPEKSMVPPLHRIFDTIQDLRKQKALTSALYECEQAVILAPENSKAHFLLGLTLKDLGEMEKALLSLARAVQIDPEFEEATKNLKSVEKQLDRRFGNSSAKDHLDQAMIHAEDDEMDLARNEIELAKTSIPELASAYTCLGEALLAVNLPEAAEESFQKAITLNPEYSKARTGLRDARVKQEESLLSSEKVVDPVDLVEVERQAEAFDEQEFEENQEDVTETPAWVYMDKQALLVKGSAGHRNRPGRSGLDPLDTQMDAYRLEGGLIRRLFTGHLRTHDPIYLALMTILGIIFALPLLFFLGALESFSVTELILIFPLNIAVICGLALLINVGLSLLSEEPEDIKQKGGKFY